MEVINRKRHLNKKILIISAISIIYCVLLVTIGNFLNYKISLGILIVSIFIAIYSLNINQSYKIFIICIPLIPMYLAIDIPGLPLLSAYRILYFLFLIDELILKRKIKKLIKYIRTDKFTKVIIAYLICMSVATVFNFNSTSIVNLISIIIEQVLLYYLICINIKDQNTIECIIDIIIKISLVLSILGIIEYLLSFNIFALLDTSQRVIASYYVRMGNLRVSTSFKHSLGYGLYLVLILPIIMYRINSLNKNKKTLKYLLSVITFILVNINVILTSSRSTLLVLLLQYFILFVMSSWRKKVVTIIVSTILFIGVLSITLTPIGEKIPGVSTVSDNINSLVSLVTGENKTQDFGDNSEPFIYRNELIKYSLSKRGKELLVGDGLGFIREKPLIFNIPELNPWEPIVSYSVDNYYVLKFLEVGAIGLISIILLFLTYLKSMFLNRKKSYLSKMLLISIIGYLVNLFMVDELETIKYLWIVFAIFSAHLRLNKICK